MSSYADVAVVDLLLAAVGHVAALSPRGAKQLAADAAYIDNILSGLGAASDGRLAELGALLTVGVDELGATAAAARALPPALAAAIAAKRAAPEA